ncbi:MAG: CBS domain-containing protein [Acidobacteriota bacterium]|jgi:CBS domain-containing protein
METSGTIRTLIRGKGGDVWSLAPSASVYNAVAMMAEKHIGAVLVIHNGFLLGIVSERDYARKVILQGRSSIDTPVSEIMSAPVTTVTPAHTVADCMRIMTDQRIRHLPVVEEGRVIAMVSIGDLVNWVISEQEDRIRHLESWIAAS